MTHVISVFVIGAGAACGGSGGRSGDGGGGDTGGVADGAGNCSTGQAAFCACSDTYGTCAADGSTICHCNRVVMGGDPGAPFSDPAVIFVEIDVVYLAADPARNVVYGSRDLGGVVAVSTETGQTLWEAPNVGLFIPWRLAVSDDGSKVYVADECEPWLERIDVATHAADQAVTLTDPPVNEPVSQIIDVAAVAGLPRSVVVSAQTGSQVALFALDDGVPRSTQSTFADRALLGIDGSATVYALLTSSGSLATLDLTGDGIAASSSPVPSLFSAGVNAFLFDGELAFGDDGHVVDPRRGVLLGVYDATGPIAVDRAGGHAYVSADKSPTMVEYDRTQFSRLRTLTVPGLDGFVSQVVRAPDGTLVLQGGFYLTPSYRGFVLIRPGAWARATSP
jgi:DNA-binding beta-propeller fold protein YncE